MSESDDDVPLTTVIKRARSEGAEEGVRPRLKRAKLENTIQSSQNGNSSSSTKRSDDGSTNAHSGTSSSSGTSRNSRTDPPANGRDYAAARASSSAKLKAAKGRESATKRGRAQVKGEAAAFRGTKTEPVDDQNGERPGAAGDSDHGSDAQPWWDGNDGLKDNGVKWKTLIHNGVMFPPEYERHGVPLLYDGKPVDLTDRCEEVATFFAAKLETDYADKQTFRKNFFDDFRATLKGTPAYKVIKSLDKCDFQRIKAHLDRKRDEKKELSAAEKKQLREAEAAKAEKYKTAIVDDREETVGNFRVEPPALFLGRGEHPRMGKVKARIYPEDVTINIGKDAPVPEVPIPGHRWGSVVHDNTVTWLAGWKDSITGGRKYVFLSAGSQFKGMSDMQKFEKARMLGKNIESIRRDYTQGWSSKSKDVRQRSVAMYLIDKLALRVGNEKSEDEADTVGCCSLRVEHLRLIPPRTVEFDFLGKDSMRYHNEVEVEKQVFDNLGLFMRKKRPEQDVFHRLTVAGLNDYLKSLMPGLSAKVFRTYNASVTLDRLLANTTSRSSPTENVVFYNKQNKEVAILCNHQRSVPKTHEAQVGKLQARISDAEAWLTELRNAERKFRVAKKKGEALTSVTVTEMKPEKPVFTEGMNDKERAAERKRAAEAPRIPTTRSMNASQVSANVERCKQKVSKLKADMTVKEDLKTVALGTSKINYLDPRITVAWCKKHDVPIERIFASTLLVKFAWAMQTPSTFRF